MSPAVEAALMAMAGAGRELERLRTVNAGDARVIATYRAELDRMIAINAELLAALERLVIDYGGVPEPTDRDGQAVFDDARAAIAKAKEIT